MGQQVSARRPWMVGTADRVCRAAELLTERHKQVLLAGALKAKPRRPLFRVASSPGWGPSAGGAEATRGTCPLSDVPFVLFSSTF